MPHDGDRGRLIEWVEQVAMFCADEYGVPPIAGRILGWLMICDPPEQSAGEIAEAIGASRASRADCHITPADTEIRHKL